MSCETPAGWEAVIGLEIHAQLKTETKIFCGCPAEYGGEPNLRTCPVCLGLPGALPVLNRRVVEDAAYVGLALGCRVAERSVMARKNYFYPDLPKGYQISQYDRPLCEGGHLDIAVDGEERRVGITRIHIEEDAGKSVHGGEWTRVDLNRSGVPLIEIVTEPDLRRPDEAHEFLVRLRQLLTWLDVCDGNMEEGSLRCDANVSVRREGDAKLGSKTELKNLNSFRGVEQALAFEIERQATMLEGGGRVESQTLLWDAGARMARPMRSKEEEHDYRYFPEPDLMPVVLSEEQLHRLHSFVPELPAACRDRLVAEHGLSLYDAEVLTAERALVRYFELVAHGTGDAKQAANWVTGELLRHVKSRGESVADFPVEWAMLSQLLHRVADGTISNSAAKTVFERLIEEGGCADDWIDQLGLAQISDEGELLAVVERVLAAHPEELRRYRAGERKLMGWFIGQMMAETKGKANPREASRLVREKLDT